MGWRTIIKTLFLWIWVSEYQMEFQSRSITSKSFIFLINYNIFTKKKYNKINQYTNLLPSLNLTCLFTEFLSIIESKSKIPKSNTS